MVSVTEGDVICGKCRRKYYTSKYENKKPEPLPATTSANLNDHMQSPKNITLPIKSVGGSHSTCFICKKRGPKLVVVPTNARFNTFVHHSIIIPAGARCCPIHIDQDSFTEQASEMLESGQYRETSNFNRTDLKVLLDKARDVILKSENKKISFDTMCDSDIFNFTGLNKNQFDDLFSHITSIRNTETRSAKTCLGIFLTKMRTGISNKILATIFNLSKDSVRRAIASVRKNLMQTFTQDNIGFQHISRKQVIDHHTRPLAQTLFGDGLSPAILVIDGTYIYIQKSSKYRFQRRSFSLHKHRPLIKPMVFVSTTGYFVSVMGPYLSDGKNNDANILKHIFATDAEEIKSWVEEGDVFVVDRGFRDSIDILRELGVKTEMPAFLDKKQKQLSVQQSNTSRLVTKIRWVVESANARIKSWKYFEKILPNSQLPYVGEFLQIVCGICNRYFPPLSSGDPQEDELIGTKMLYLAKQNNQLKEEIENENLDKITKSKWEKLESSSLVFPVMTEDEIRSMAIGIYHVNLAKSYIQEHMQDNAEFEVYTCKQSENLICVKLQSRHVSSKHHLLWIHFDACSVRGWYCRCRSGSRVVGMCAHITSVIWYLGYARHLSQPFRYKTDWTLYFKDAKDMPEPESIDESDEETDPVEE